MMRRSFTTLLAACLSLSLGAGCVDDMGTADEATGTFRFSLLSERPEGFFQLRILTSAPDQNLNGDVLFDTRCVEARSQVYELSGIEAGTGYWVVIEAFTSPACDASSRTELGFRGEVDVFAAGTVAKQPQYHVTLFRTDGATALPENLNISASLAERYSDGPCDDSKCESQFGKGYTCFDAQAPQYWCLPGCATDADCNADDKFHPNATCDTTNKWCMLRHPFPLNLSEPRAFGYATTLSSGKPVFFGGFGFFGGGSLGGGNQVIEAFDPSVGLFERPTVSGMDTFNGALGGFAELGNDKVVVVGGATGAKVTWTKGAAATDQATIQLTVPDTSLLDQVAVIDFASGTATIGTLGTRIAGSAVVALDARRFLVAGGLVAGQPSKSLWTCELDSSNKASCTAATDMKAARAGAAASCIDDTCSRVLILGGNTAGPQAEFVEAPAGGSVTVGEYKSPGIKGDVFAPTLCGLRLVGGSSKVNTTGGRDAGTLTPVGDQLSLEPVKGTGDTALRVYPTTVEFSDGSCWVAGGVDKDGTSGRILRLSGDTVVPTSDALVNARFGALGARIDSGPLAGTVLFGGGLRTVGSNVVEMVRGAEVVYP